MHSVISVNGQRYSPQHLSISPLDRGVTLGDGIFETMRMESGTVWYFDRHLTRLERAARHMGIPYPSHVREWITELLTDSEVTAAPLATLRITLTRGVAQTHGLAANIDTPTTIITATPLAPFPEATYSTGLTVMISSAPLNEHAHTAGFKTTSYAESVLAVREAYDAGYDDALFLNTQGFVAEASASNVFAWLGDTLMTPSLECGILPGITRNVIIELSAGEHIPTEERLIMLDELTHATEVFCTSSIRGIVPIITIGDKRIGTGTPGSQTRALMARYAAQSRRV